MKKILLTGSTGFLGSALFQKLNLKLKGYQIDVPDSDIRHYRKSDHRYDYVFHFAAPSSQVLFNRSLDYCVNTTINGFLNALKIARESGAKLVYPSTGLLSAQKQHWNEYAMCKYLTEQTAQNSAVETLGLRIFATYGPGEEHKREYKSVIGLFLDDVMQGRDPIIFGDGNQRRDFVYIDDTAESIINFAQIKTGIHEIGTGVSWSFNEVIETIKKVTGKKITPKYINKPESYINEAVCKDPVKDYTPLEEGINNYWEYLNV